MSADAPHAPGRTVGGDGGDAPHADGAPSARQPGGVLGWYLALIRRVAGARWFTWLGVHVLTRLDQWLYPRFHGRLVSAGPPILPLLLLTTVGRVSGRPRSTPLLYLADGGDVVVVGSNWGQAHHPAWSSNLLARPRATIEINGRRREVVAHLASPAEQARVWPRLLAHFPPYQTYARRSHRDLRVFILHPLA
jgi:deazaflavin-dependent oxidoreductase (nitroreductase family)